MRAALLLAGLLGPGIALSARADPRPTGPDGAAGADRVRSAHLGEAGSVRLGLSGGFFASDSFPVADGRHRQTNARLAAAWTALPWLEASAAVGFLSNSSARTVPHLIQAVGDLSLGATAAWAPAPDWRVGGLLSLALPAGVGSVSLAPKAAGGALRALGSWSRPANVGGRPIRLALAADAGLVLDRSGAVLPTDPKPTVLQEYSLGTARFSQFQTGVWFGVAAPPVEGFLEFGLGAPLGVDDADLADTESGKPATYSQILVTRIVPGLRYAPLPGLALDAAFEWGLGGGVVRGFASAPPWAVRLGVTVSLDPYAATTQRVAVATPAPPTVQAPPEPPPAPRCEPCIAEVSTVSVSTLPTDGASDGRTDLPGAPVPPVPPAATAAAAGALPRPPETGDFDVLPPEAVPGAAPAGGLAFDLPGTAAAPALGPSGRGGAPGFIEGTVQLPRGRPGAELAVRWLGADLAPTATDARGAFRSPALPSGRFGVVVRAAGFQPLTTLVDVRSGETTKVALELVPGPSSARLALRARAGTAAVKARLTGPEPREAETGAERTALLEDLPAGDYRLVLSAEGHLARGRSLRLADGETLPVEVALEPIGARLLAAAEGGPRTAPLPLCGSAGGLEPSGARVAAELADLLLTGTPGPTRIVLHALRVRGRPAAQAMRASSCAAALRDALDGLGALSPETELSSAVDAKPPLKRGPTKGEWVEVRR